MQFLDGYIEIKEALGNLDVAEKENAVCKTYFRANQCHIP